MSARPLAPLAARDHRIDLLRGFALATIFINHVPGNVAERLTTKNFGLSDSAELFVLLAGMAAAFAYYPRFDGGDRLLATGRAVKRAGTLYVAHLASTLVGLAIFCFGALAFAAPGLLDEINIPPLLEDPVRGLIGLATLTHQLGYHNILPMYVCLLLGVPLIMTLARIGPGVLLSASLILYGLTQVFGLTPPNYPGEGGWFFNPFAWQLIFVVGFLVGMRMMQGLTPVPYIRWLWLAAGAYLVAAMIYHRWNLYGSIPNVPFLPHNFQINEKPWLALPRLTHILSLAYFVGHSPLMRWLGRAGQMNPLVLLGRNALPVFWTGTALSMVGQVIMRTGEIGPALQVALLTFGLGIQLALAFGLDWIARAEKRRRTASQFAVQAPARTVSRRPPVAA
ncbi:MAG TPA: OpgC domain-containing protein [Methylomirabilota bacterium]|nr:OpgC domain-containing protein [Methylomirabilota bacterium]